MTCRNSLIYDTGTIKLADFGLSKSLPVNKHASYDLDATFRLTGETGSYRYMAPEVFRHEPYNYKVDVYSFSMIAYQLFEHMPPFAGMDPVAAAKAAALRDSRPAFNKLNDQSKPYQVQHRISLVVTNGTFLAASKDTASTSSVALPDGCN